MLGTDFKAGQTKFKTAAVEYIRSLGMCPKVSALLGRARCSTHTFWKSNWLYPDG